MEGEGDTEETCPLDDSDWGPVRPQVDKWCFLGKKTDTVEELSQNEYYKHLYSIIDRHGKDPILPLCKRVQKCYDDFFREDQKRREWSLRSIRKYITKDHDFTLKVNVHKENTRTIKSIMADIVEDMKVKNPATGKKHINYKAVQEWNKMRKAYNEEETFISKLGGSVRGAGGATASH